MAPLVDAPWWEGEGSPAILLEPAFELRGAVPSGLVKFGQAFDVGGDKGFTICARVRRSSVLEGEQAPSGVVLRKGVAPAGWVFFAPSAVGAAVAFEGGDREQPPVSEAEADATPPAAAPDVKAAGKKGSAPAAPEPVVDDGLPPRGPADVGEARIDNGEWHHVAISFRRQALGEGHGNWERDGRVRAFVDGRFDGMLGLEVAACPSAELEMGEAGPEEADGDAPRPLSEVKDVQAFSEALTDAQIAALADRKRELPSGLLVPLSPSDVAEFWSLRARSPAKVAAAPSQDPDEALGHSVADGDEARMIALSVAEGLGTEATRGFKGEDGDKVFTMSKFQDRVICDFFVDLLDHASSLCLTARKAAVFAGIARRLFELMHRRSTTSPCVGERATVSEVFLEYKQLLLQHAGARSAASPSNHIEVFTVPEVRRLTEFVSASLFQHFVLYQCVLVCPQETSTVYGEVALSRPHAPPRLAYAKLLPPPTRAGHGRSSAVGACRAPSPRASGLEDTGLPDGGDYAADEGDADGGEPGADGAAEDPEVGDGASTFGGGDAEVDVDEHHARVSKAAGKKLDATIDASDTALGIAKE